METKLRLDQILVERKLAESREKAQALILSGNVLVDDEPCTKAGAKFSINGIEVRIRGETKTFVSRGAYKLLAALESFGLKSQLNGTTALDVGASTGGFTQVLLESGVAKVYAVDVGTNQMDHKIRRDPRVVVQERTNARNLKFEDVGQKVDTLVVDVSFISLAKIVPALLQFSNPETNWITLIKPQFEAGPGQSDEGIIRDLELRKKTVDRVIAELESLGLKHLGLIESPIRGQKGNVEYLAHFRLR